MPLCVGPLYFSAGVDGRSPLGRFLRQLEAELVKYVGGEPIWITQRLLIGRIVRMSAQLDAFDQKLAGDSWNDTDRRTFGTLNNALRLALKELTPASSRNQPADLETYIASMRALPRVRRARPQTSPPPASLAQGLRPPRS